MKTNHSNSSIYFDTGVLIPALVIAAQLFLSLEAVPAGRIDEDANGAIDDSANQVSQSSDSRIETMNSDLEGTGIDNEDEIIFEGDIYMIRKELNEFYDIDEETEEELFSAQSVNSASHVNKRQVATRSPIPDMDQLGCSI